MNTENTQLKRIMVDDTIMNTITKLKSAPGIVELIDADADVFLVGGCVRDAFMGTTTKDIDIVVTELTQETIVDILSPFGKVDAVGESFGVIKFTPNGWNDEPIDIALPRTETKVGNGHQAFDVVSDPFLSIEEDLRRRDLTINAIAISIVDGTVVDPFGGVDDIEHKIISCVDKNTFMEDPLRIMRAFQFASRFNGWLDEDLFDLIVDNSSTVSEISGERIFIELEKMFKKRLNEDALEDAMKLMNQTGVAHKLFGHDIDLIVSDQFVDFMFDVVQGDADQLKDLLKADSVLVSMVRTMNALEKSNNVELVDFVKAAHKHPKLKDSVWFNFLLWTDSLDKEFENVNVWSVSDLAIGGNDLLAKGMKGKTIGDTLKRLFVEVLSGKLANTKDVLLENV